MTGLTLSLVMQVALAAPGATPSYSEAYQDCKQTGRPLLVMVGAKWCPSCQVMKPRILDMHRRGKLDRVAFTAIDYDRDREVAEQLISGGPVPQLILFHKTSTGWRRHKLIGPQSETNVLSLMGRAKRAASKVVPAAASE